MQSRNRSHSRPRRLRRVRARRAARAGGALVTLVLAAVVAMTALAVAKSNLLSVATVKLTGPSGKRTEPIAVTGSGLSVYWLSGETTKHLLCTSPSCLQFWPPVKVASGAKLTKAAGLTGRLGTLRRHGFEQLTLNGHPVYTFAGDGGKRSVATGDGVVSFGGTWHVFAEGKSSSAASDPSMPAPTTTTTTSPYPSY